MTIQAAQSSMIGISLTLLAVVTQRLVERRRAGAVLFGEASGLIAAGCVPGSPRHCGVG